jgi:hypothetical protein
VVKYWLPAIAQTHVLVWASHFRGYYQNFSFSRMKPDQRNSLLTFFQYMDERFYNHQPMQKVWTSSIHRNTEFRHTNEIKGKINFLDVIIVRSQDHSHNTGSLHMDACKVLWKSSKKWNALENEYSQKNLQVGLNKKCCWRNTRFLSNKSKRKWTL